MRAGGHSRGETGDVSPSLKEAHIHPSVDERDLARQLPNQLNESPDTGPQRARENHKFK